MLLGMNLLLWTRSVTADHRALLDALAETGYDGVELPVLDGTAEAYRNIGKQLDDLGLRRTGITVLGPDKSCISDAAAVRQAALDHIRWAIDCLELAGGEVLVGPYHQPLFQIHGKPPTPIEIERLVDVHRRAAEHAAEAGIRLAVEPLNRFECYVCTTAAQAAELVAEVDRPNYGFLYDTFHANIEEADPVGSLRRHLGAIGHVHLSENDRGSPGKGHVPWEKTLRTLKSSGYAGWCVIESFGRRPMNPGPNVRIYRDICASDKEVYVEGHDFLRELWEKV
ncbi:sugar phosphate isomerase/epimerase family protein [Piscinibacter sakaiensis]|uniref:sugar phosphate isomerase/epimerase family protein n=1 Tax=Piscinibacter sakaiensis TaxID=1547922 RepID=UPI003AAA404F